MLTAACGTTGTSASTHNVGGRAGHGARNLVLSTRVRAQLLAAGAALHRLPISDYLGLSPGVSYYAKDLADGHYWAGAGLLPRPGSYQAEVSNQDRGAYMIFTRSQTKGWHGWETGLTGGPSACPVKVPSAVLKVWGWAFGTCDPPPQAVSSETPSSEGGRRCQRSQLDVQLTGTAQAQAQYQLVLEFANTSSSPCTLVGFPDFELVGPLSNGSDNYDPARQQVTYAPVTLVPGESAHANFFVLPGPDLCDGGQAWEPTEAIVTLPGATNPIDVGWPGGSVDNCQGGATHPGTFIGPIEAGP
ncbi:MAG: DUF4232 domain-containing protein [Acidimicrobiales bacterium]